MDISRKPGVQSMPWWTQTEYETRSRIIFTQTHSLVGAGTHPTLKNRRGT